MYPQSDSSALQHNFIIYFFFFTMSNRMDILNDAYNSCILNQPVTYGARIIRSGCVGLCLCMHAYHEYYTILNNDDEVQITNHSLAVPFNLHILIETISSTLHNTATNPSLPTGNYNYLQQKFDHLK